MVHCSHIVISWMAIVGVRILFHVCLWFYDTNNVSENNLCFILHNRTWYNAGTGNGRNNKSIARGERETQITGIRDEFSWRSSRVRKREWQQTEVEENAHEEAWVREGELQVQERLQ